MLTFAVDWLNYTALQKSHRLHHEFAEPITGAVFEPQLPAKGYNRGLGNQHGARISWHNARDDMGHHVQYSGSALNNYRDQGITWQMLAQSHYGHGDKCTRVDLAIDVREMGLNIGELAEMTKSGDASVKVKTYSHITSQNGGETLYLGSRQSEQFLRIYNKAAETNFDGDWVRVELECKGSRANEIGRRLALQSEEEIVAMTRGLVRNMANFDAIVWQNVVGGMSVSIAKAHAKEPDTKGWLLGAVAPSMAKYIRETGDQDIIEQFLAIVDAFMVNS